VWAGDFFDNGKWNPRSRPLDRVRSLGTSGLSVRETIHKQLAHLSYERISQAPYLVGEIVMEVALAMQRFAEDEHNKNYEDLARLRELLGPSWPVLGSPKEPKKRCCLRRQ
jgi:hypothetical protein